MQSKLVGVVSAHATTHLDFFRQRKVVETPVTTLLAEGAGAAGLSAAAQQRGRWQGRRVGVALSGGNVDGTVFARVLAAE